ncbi:LysR family transcriptional regulator [Roseateles sp.]|uniref:LysR family transcriptional regulator n=1 Tax=Roseateles sp. TaxID=1971397 RepID=UPI00286BD0F1|nr:LysR family transcriptional regulator [Roseateles sp.]
MKLASSLDINLIRLAVVLAKHGNFARAAESLHMAQPTLSRSIARLEATLGVPIFDRTRDGVVPTEFGRLVIERGRELLNGSRELFREIALLQGVECGQLKVACGPFPYAISAGRALAGLMKSHPQVQFRLGQHSPKATVEQVLGGAVDLGLADTREWLGDPRLEIEALPQHRAVWVCRAGHPLAGRRDLCLQDALNYPLICGVMPPQVGAMFGDHSAAGQRCAESGQFYPAVTLDCMQLGPALAAASDALFLASPLMATEELRRGELDFLDLHLPWQHTHYGFIHKRARTLSPVTLAFMDLVRGFEQEALGQEQALLSAHFSARPAAVPHGERSKAYLTV